MSRADELLESLRSAGFRLTPQRVMILSAIASSSGHMTAENIHERVKKSYPFIDIATVYRTIQLLKRQRLLVEIDLGSGAYQYELTQDQRHHHIVCRECGTTLDIDHHRFLEPVRVALKQEYEFEADLDHFAIFGICSSCRSSAQSVSNPID